MSGFTSENVEAAIEAAIRHTAEAVAQEIETYRSSNSFKRWITTEQAAEIARGITKRLITK